MNKRNAWIAGIASLLVPGLGHLYAGAPGRGLMIVACFLSSLLLGGVFGAFSTKYGMAMLAAIALLFSVVLIVSAVIEARRSEEYELRWFNRWYWYVAAFLIVSLGLQAFFVFRGSILGYESFQIHAQSMVPTLEVGDFIAVDTRYREPAIGDVIVFHPPTDPEGSYVKRVAAIGGDRIAIQNGDVVINGVVEDKLFVPADSRRREYSVSMAARQVPEGSFFVLGDLRDNSNDSRFWGTVPDDNLVGKVTYIWYSSNAKRIGTRVR